MNILKYLKKLIKYITVIIGICVILRAIAIGSMIFYGPAPRVDVSGGFVSEIINSAIGMPGKQLDYVINDSPEIEPIPADYWYNMNCNVYNKYKDWRIPPQFESAAKAQLACIEVEDNTGISPRNDVGKALCRNYLNCQVLKVRVDDYILSHPKILWNILKVAEKPCAYLKTPDMIAEGPDKHYTTSVIKEIRESMFCDGAPYYMRQRKFTLIRVIDRKNNRSTEIIVRRKDID
jgi:hypothetical protein